MNKPEFKLLPCVFCTLGYNTYVAGHRLISKGAELLSNDTHTTNTPNITEQLPPITIKPHKMTNILKE
ncbi:MAG: hypothetical protein JKX78_12895 [Alteromonadaceae bacterium]|nr:hypothetical protein [Alteromonadaceae bacterium]